MLNKLFSLFNNVFDEETIWNFNSDKEYNELLNGYNKSKLTKLNIPYYYTETLYITEHIYDMFTSYIDIEICNNLQINKEVLLLYFYKGILMQYFIKDYNNAIKCYNYIEMQQIFDNTLFSVFINYNKSLIYYQNNYRNLYLDCLNKIDNVINIIKKNNYSIDYIENKYYNDHLVKYGIMLYENNLFELSYRTLHTLNPNFLTHDAKYIVSKLSLILGYHLNFIKCYDEKYINLDDMFYIIKKYNIKKFTATINVQFKFTKQIIKHKLTEQYIKNPNNLKFPELMVFEKFIKHMFSNLYSNLLKNFVEYKKNISFVDIIILLKMFFTNDLPHKHITKITNVFTYYCATQIATSFDKYLSKMLVNFKNINNEMSLYFQIYEFKCMTLKILKNYISPFDKIWDTNLYKFSHKMNNILRYILFNKYKLKYILFDEILHELCNLYSMNNFDYGILNLNVLFGYISDKIIKTYNNNVDKYHNCNLDIIKLFPLVRLKNNIFQNKVCNHVMMELIKDFGYIPKGVSDDNIICYMILKNNIIGNTCLLNKQMILYIAHFLFI